VAPLERTARSLSAPFHEFTRAQSNSGWTLLAATLAAVALANSPYRQLYSALLHLDLRVGLADYEIDMTLQHWVSDGLMAVFFFLIGLELKRELLVGQLSDLRRAASVMMAALGGMLVPAAIFLIIAVGENVRDGWGIPIATDTAFALTILVLLGKRVPPAARAFLVGLAIVDDLGAILVVTFAYTGSLNTALLLPVAAVAGGLVALNLAGVRKALPYGVLGIALWLLFLDLGVHGTVAGVVVAVTAPVRPAISRLRFVRRLARRVDEFEMAHDTRTATILEQPEQQALATDVKRTAEAALPPIDRWERRLQIPVSFLIMPAFAFMNAGVAISGAASWLSPLSLGIGAGLLVGKPLGIAGGLWLGERLGLAKRPHDLSWGQLIGIGLLGSIGFTMSLFIAALSFGEGSEFLDSAKQSVIATSIIAGLLGYVWLRWICPRLA
jgi:NhaA family Na+:H+ antiporter